MAVIKTSHIIHFSIIKMKKKTENNYNFAKIVVDKTQEEDQNT